VKKMIYSFVICLTMTNEFGICATGDDVVRLEQDDLSNQQLEVNPQNQVVEVVSVNESVDQHYVSTQSVDSVPQAETIPMDQTTEHYMQLQ